VSEDNDLYVWGGQASEVKKINALPRPSDKEDVRLVDIKGGIDVVDVGVGNGHIVALTGDGEVWTTGEGDYGQVGTGRKAFEEDWVQARGAWEGKGSVVAVGCGVWCSWVLIDTRVDSKEDI
jgi:alpha-tubulin suppressor-like RCC1 family protein